MSIRKMVFLALLAAQALALNVLEMYFPVPIPLPGVKLGLANIITLTALNFFGLWDVLIIVAIRVLIASFFGGGPMVLLFSAAGGILSTFAMFFTSNALKKNISIWSISVVGAIFHNIGQLFAASIVIKDAIIFTYLPILLVSSVITGIFVGVVSMYLIKALSKILKSDIK